MPRLEARRSLFVLAATTFVALVLFLSLPLSPASLPSFRSRHPRVNLWRVAQWLGLTTSPLMADFVPAPGGVYRDSWAETAARPELTLMSYNIRYDNVFSKRPPAGSPPGQDVTNPARLYGEYSWSVRRHAIADAVLMTNPDVFVFQEVLHSQLLDLVFLLGDDYDWIGVGRDDGKQKGEAVPVFWRKDKFALVGKEGGGVGKHGWEHFWLSETPSVVGSKGWDAALTRMCTHVTLQPLSASASASSPLSPPSPPSPPDYPRTATAPIHVLSTHYDHKGLVARAKSSQLIVARANAARAHTLATLGVEPLVLLAGDLNSPREERGWQELVRGYHGIPARRGDTQEADADAEPMSFHDVQLSLPTRFGLAFDPRVVPLVDGQTPQTPQTQHDPSPSAAHRQRQRGVLSTAYGPPASFTDWDAQRDRSTAEDRIDFIFVGDNQPVLPREAEGASHAEAPDPYTEFTPVHGDDVGKRSAQRAPRPPLPRRDGAAPGWRIKTAGVLSNWDRVEGGVKASDHRPVVARLRWE